VDGRRFAAKVIVLDTHVLLWVRTNSRQLGRRAHRLIERASAKNELCFAAISLYEIGQHLSKGRVALDEPIADWRRRAIDDGIAEISLDGVAAIRAAELSGLPGDPFDRLITATAERVGACLMTADAAILDWTGALKRLDARE
jgi:PIN domain nuclease of toxin-antitoxin system